MAEGLRFKTARELYAAYPTASRDLKAVPTDQSPLEFCRSLLAGKTPEEAITFCAYLLPNRTAIWWGHECLTRITDLLEEQDRRLLALVHDWVGDPQERRYHEAMDEMASTRQMTPAVWIALATGWDDQGPGEGLEKQPLPVARAVNAGILAGLARVALADRSSVLTTFVEMGIQFAEAEALRPSRNGL